MFGIIYTLASLIGFGISGVGAAIENEQAKERGRQRALNGDNPGNTYIDRKGAMRDLATGNFADLRPDNITGDIWLRHGAPSVRVKNLSAEWRNNFYEEKKAHPEQGRTVINDIEITNRIVDDPKQYKYSEERWDNTYYCEGQWYKDLETGALYVIRKAKIDPKEIYDKNYYGGHMPVKRIPGYHAEFYMDIHTRQLVRPSDDFIESNKDGHVPEDKLQEMMNDWNKGIADGSKDAENRWSRNTSAYWHEYYFSSKNVFKGNRSYEEYDMMGRVRPRHF